MYLYLSQIPYTGLDLGPVGTALYWIALIGWSLALAYLVLFSAVPVANRRLRSFGARVRDALNARALAPVNVPVDPIIPAFIAPQAEHVPEALNTYSSYDGFKSYARNGALSIEDIVKGLSRQSRQIAAAHKEPVVEPVYENVEPIYEQVEAIPESATQNAAAITAGTVQTPPHIRGFASALVEGDRAAVFAGLREHTRGAGAPERLLSGVVCLVDDVYRSRIDGTVCDPDLARLAARLDTPTLEKLVASLAIAIDSSYTDSMTGAKLALTRALTVLGA